MKLFDVAATSPVPAPKAAPKSIPRSRPVPVVPTPIPSPSTLPPEVVALLAQASAEGGGCDLAAAVQAALRADSHVTDAMELLPRDARSVANAIMVWNHGWVTADQLDPVVLDSFQSTILAPVEAATPECRQADQSGPRFLSIGSTDAVVVVLGSGQWRWQDLVDTAQPATAVPPAPGTVPPVVATREQAFLF